MSKQCPKCRLYNPSEALRCDCGYDFVSKTNEVSYAAVDAIKRQGVEGFFGGVGKRNIQYGILLILLSVGFAVAGWVMSRSSGSPTTVGFPLIPLVVGLYRFAKGMTARNTAKRAVAALRQAHAELDEPTRQRLAGIFRTDQRSRF